MDLCCSMQQIAIHMQPLVGICSKAVPWAPKRTLLLLCWNIKEALIILLGDSACVHSIMHSLGWGVLLDGPPNLIPQDNLLMLLLATAEECSPILRNFTPGIHKFIRMSRVELPFLSMFTWSFLNTESSTQDYFPETSDLPKQWVWAKSLGMGNLFCGLKIESIVKKINRINLLNFGKIFS